MPSPMNIAQYSGAEALGGITLLICKFEFSYLGHLYCHINQALSFAKISLTRSRGLNTIIKLTLTSVIRMGWGLGWNNLNY